MADLGHPTPPLWYAGWEHGLRELAIAIQRIMRGETNNAGTFTLTADTTTTTVTDLKVGANTKIMYAPTTANASAEIAAGAIRISSKTKDSFVVTHVSNSQTDRDFDYSLSG